MLCRLILALTCLLLPTQIAAQCRGKDMFAAMAPAQSALIDDAVARAPYPSGNHWRATRAGSVINIIGTFHIFDRRMPEHVARLEPVLRAAQALYLEATAVELAQVSSELLRNPEILSIGSGATLPERLPPEEWTWLADEMRARQIPAFLAAKFRPWYVAMILATPPCAMTALVERREGFDHMMMQAAEAAGVPMHALEPYDTVFKIFSRMPDDKQLEMVRTTLPLAAQSEDFFVTMADAYFSQQHRRIWELSRMQATAATAGTDSAANAADFALMEESLLKQRNRAWMDVILPAAAGRNIVVAVGAAHLSGDEGVLNLLAQNGYMVEVQPF